MNDDAGRLDAPGLRRAASNNLVVAFALNRFSIGRRLFTFNQVVELSGTLKLKNEKLSGSVGRAIEIDLETRRLEPNGPRRRSRRGQAWSLGPG